MGDRYDWRHNLCRGALRKLRALRARPRGAPEGGRRVRPVATRARLAPSRAGVLLAAVLAATACERGGHAAADPPADRSAHEASARERIETAVVQLGRVQGRITASSSIVARRSTAIGAEVPGRLVEVMVDLGDAVAAGAPLFRIDPVPYELALADARAGLALARAESENAAAEAARAAHLVEQSIASKQQHEKLLTAAAVARASVAQMEARVDRAERDLARTVVRAPYAGSIVERRFHEGAMLGQEPVVVLLEVGALEVVVDVPESAPVPVSLGDTLRLYAASLPEPLVAKVERVSEQIEAETRTYRIRGRVDDPTHTLKAGSYVRAEILSASREPRPVVPRSSVLSRDGRDYVFLLRDGVVARVPVRVGAEEEDRVELLAGVAAGDRVAVGDAVPRLVDGQHVDVALEPVPPGDASP